MRIINAAVKEETPEMKQEQRRTESVPLAVSPEFQPLYELCRRDGMIRPQTRIVRRSRKSWRSR